MRVLKNILWRSDIYKHRSVSAAFINHIRVGVICYIAKDKRFDVFVLLPGIPKIRNAFLDFDKAKEHLEERIQFWFKQVDQEDEQRRAAHKSIR